MYNYSKCCGSQDMQPKHPRPFVEEEAMKMTTQEMKKIWPRQHCRNCEAMCYVSKAQYVVGDY